MTLTEVTHGCIQYFVTELLRVSFGLYDVLMPADMLQIFSFFLLPSFMHQNIFKNENSDPVKKQSAVFCFCVLYLNFRNQLRVFFGSKFGITILSPESV